MPHYHRRYRVSLLSSAWDQVVPRRYGRQANSLIQKADVNNDVAYWLVAITEFLSSSFIRYKAQNTSWVLYG
jgi:hypothetical protein